MRNKLTLTAFTLLLYLNTVSGQSLSDIEKKYGKPQPVYSVSEHVWMTPEYAADGQACFMRLYPKRVAPRANYLDDRLDMDEVLKVINELIPPEERGGRKGFFGMSTLGGGVSLTEFGYERVTFTFVSSFRLKKLPDRPSEEFPIEDVSEEEMAELRRKEAMRPDDELIRERAARPQVLEVRWTGRECVTPQARSNNSFNRTRD